MNAHNKNARLSPVLAALALVIGLWLGGATLAQAQLLESESFDYTGMALGGQSGGTGWGDAWANADGLAALSDDDTSLVYPVTVNHTATGDRLTFSTVSMVDRLLGTSIPLLTNGPTHYVSALVKRQGAMGFDLVDNQSRTRWHFGGATNAPDGIVAVDPGASAQRSTGTNIFPLNETVLVVAKMLTQNPGNDRVFLNVYRSGDTVPLVEPTTWQATASGGSGVTLIRLRIRNMDALPLEVDELRVGTSWVDVAYGPFTGLPVIVRQPASVVAYAGDTVQFSVEAVGQQPLSYQWYHGATPVSGATNAALTIANVQEAQLGTYTVTVSNSAGNTPSDPVTLSLVPITDISVGLKALWHFDEKTGLTAFDATTNHNHGTLFNYVGDDSQWVSSDYNGALAFNRALSNYVDVPHHASIGANLANRFSVATWIRSAVPLSVNGNAYRVMEKENTFFLLQGDGNTNNVGSGGMNLLVKKGGANLCASIGQALDANRWYHLAGTFDGATLRVYLDGELKGTRAVAAPIDTTTLPLRIGSDYVATSAGSRFDGTIDEVGIWERALQPSEILQLAGQTGVPVILEQPQPQTVYAGSSALLRVRARGQAPLRYLWFRGTNEIRSATSNVLALVNVQSADAGEYRCRVSNDLGDTFSEIAILTVLPVTSITDGMAALWKFDEASGLVAADSSGQGRDGQLLAYAGDDTQWTAGRVNGALQFDGQSNRVVAANSSLLNLGNDVTFAFWIRPTSYGTLENAGTYLRNAGRILRKGGYFDLETVDDPGSVRATVRANGVPAPQQNILNLNEWQHFAVVFSGGMVSFYKNGFRLGDPVVANLGATNTNSVVLGTYNEDLTQTNLFAGAMDEVGIWSRTLSEVEILTLAGQDVAGVPVIVAPPQSATRYVGSTVDFFVNATGKRPVTYQWWHESSPLPDSNTNKLVLTNLTLADAGNYTVRVQNDLGFVVSAPPATLTVLEVTNLTVGLVAYWTFDETEGTILHDTSGRGHHATLQNGAAAPGVPGMIGGAFNFDGTDDFAVVPHAPELSLDGQATISVWINPRTLATTGDRMRIVRKDINFDFTLYTSGSRFMMYGQNKTEIFAPANSVTVNEWQHLAVVVKDGTLQFFKNGRALANPVPGLLGPSVTNDLIIANFGPDLSIKRLLNGYMDELGIWDRALSATEVDGIYQNGLLGKPLNEPFTPFRIQTVGFPNASQVQLLFSSPYTGREHIVERKDDLEAAWAQQTPVNFTYFAGGLAEALFDKPAGNTAFYRVTVLPQAAIFADDFETGAPGWTHGGAGDNWQLGTPVNGPAVAASGTNVYATSLTGNLEPFTDAYLRSPPINLAGVSRATLTFKQWRNVDPDVNFHWCTVSVLDASNLTPLQELSREAGFTSDWQLSTLPLPPSLLGRNVILEFRVTCDNYNLLEGWYIDDVKVLPE